MCADMLKCSRSLPELHITVYFINDENMARWKTTLAFCGCLVDSLELEVAGLWEEEVATAPAFPSSPSCEDGSVYVANQPGHD
jgi:hypothetical protein